MLLEGLTCMALCMSHFENVSDFSLHACFLYFSQHMAILSVVACIYSKPLVHDDYSDRF